jgi:FkbM family methyltransferase
MSIEPTGPKSELDSPIPLDQAGHWKRVTESGIDCCFWIGEKPDTLQSVIEATGSFYEIGALRLLRELLPPSPRIVDVGANIGNHSVYFSRICGAEWVLPLEPNPDLLPELRANLEANHCDAADLTYLGIAAGAERGRLRLQLDPVDAAIRNRGGMRLVAGHGEAESPVEVVPLDEIVAERVDLIKIDVEGMGIAVLEGARTLIERHRPLIYIEVGVEEMPAMSEWLRSRMYRILAALADYPGLTNMLLQPIWRPAGDDRGRSSNAEARIAGALSAAAAAEARAERASMTTSLADARAVTAEGLALESERRAVAAGARATELEERAAAAEARATELQERAVAAEARASESQQRAAAAEARAANVEQELLARFVEIQRLSAFKATLLWRAAASIGRAFSPMSPEVRLNLRRATRVLWWTATLQLPARLRERRARFAAAAPHRTPRAQSSSPAPSAPLPAATTTAWDSTAARAAGGPRALVVDSRWPSPDRDEGSVIAMNLVSGLIALGYSVVFYAEDSSAGRYRSHLERHGVTCLSPASSGPLERFLEAEGETLALCVLNRVHSGGRYFEQVRRLAGAARVIFNTVDLHFLREEREARLKADRRGVILAAATRERELYLVRQADATMVVSSEEHRLLEACVPGARIVEMPLARELHQPATGFADRTGIGFIGGFAHTPNVDAVRFFIAEVWPRVLPELPGCEFTIAGPDLPSEVLAGSPARVRYLGHVPELAPWFDGLRVTVAPLRYGAGAKGKVASSLAHGVPCVATPLAVEGVRLRPGVDVLIGTTPAELAARLCDAYRDAELWSRLSSAGLEFAARELSPEVWRGMLGDLLGAVGLPHEAAPAPGRAGEPGVPR